MKRSIALFALALAACTNGQGQADVTMENTVTFAGVPAGTPDITLPTVAITTDGSISIDVKDEIASMGKLGTLSATVSKNELAGDSLVQIQHIKTTIATADGTIAEEVLTDVDVPANSHSVELPLLLPDAQVLDYLEEGKVTLHFYVTGTPTTKPIVLTHTLVAHVNLAVQGSVLKF
jgi:hypothetical protein